MPDPESTIVTTSRALRLIRIGWCVAELRGRVWIGGSLDPGRFLPPIRVRHALPLAQERSPKERLNELRQVFAKLCTEADLGLSSDGMLDFQGNAPATPGTAGSQRIADLSNSVPASHDDPNWNGNWNAFAEALYKYDERVQDALSAGPFGESSAYQLGRALAETSWELELKAPRRSFPSWEYLLGPERTLAITDIVNRMTPVGVPSDIARAINGSLAAWQRLVAEDKVRDDPSAVVRLRQQVELWRDLLLSGADPQAIVRPKASLARISTIGPVLRTLLPQIVIAVISTAALGAAAWFLSSHHSTAGPIGAIVAALSLFGITGSTISASAKSSANQTLSRLRTAVAADLIVEQATILPDKSTEVTNRASVSTPGEVAEPVSVTALPSFRASTRGG